MGQIVVSEIVSLDGVAEDPSGEEDSARGGWFTQTSEANRAAWVELMQAEAHAATALLLGRRTDAWFAARWPARDGAWADRLNAMPKYVVSGTLREPRWGNATVLRGDVAGEVRALKRELAGDIVVYASVHLVHTLLDEDLVDELRLTVFPVVVGAGERLLGPTGGRKPLRLNGLRTLGDDLAFLSYRAQ